VFVLFYLSVYTNYRRRIFVNTAWCWFERNIYFEELAAQIPKSSISIITVSTVFLCVIATLRRGTQFEFTPAQKYVRP
jgi:hypothetical protein